MEQTVLELSIRVVIRRTQMMVTVGNGGGEGFVASNFPQGFSTPSSSTKSASRQFWKAGTTIENDACFAGFCRRHGSS